MEPAFPVLGTGYRQAGQWNFSVWHALLPCRIGLSQAEALSVKICAQGVQDIGGQTVVKEKPEQIVAVMSGSLKPYSYFVLRCATFLDSLQQAVEPIQGIGNCEHIRQDFTIRADNKAIVLIF